MEITPSGIFKGPVKPVLVKAYSSIIRLSVSDRTSFVMLLKPQKADAPIYATLLGIFSVPLIFVPKKASSPMEITPLGIIKVPVKPVPAKA